MGEKRPKTSNSTVKRIAMLWKASCTICLCHPIQASEDSHLCRELRITVNTSN